MIEPHWVPWAPRAFPASDAARAVAMKDLDQILSKFRSRPMRAPTRAETETRRAQYLEWKDKHASLGQRFGKA